MVSIVDLYIAEWHKEKVKPRLCQGIGGRVLGVVLRDIAFESVKQNLLFLIPYTPKAVISRVSTFVCAIRNIATSVANVIMECSLATKLTVQLPNNCSKIK